MTFSSLGAGGGPILLGILTDQFGFREATSTSFGIVGGMLLLVCTKLCWNVYMHSHLQDNTPEAKPLLGPLSRE